MSPKKVKVSEKQRSTQDWVLDTLRALSPGGRLSTTKIAKKITKASGRSYHENSIYNALRALVSEGTIGMARSGREKLYFIRNSAPRTPAVRSSTPKVSTSAAPPTPNVAIGALPHRLGLGDILVLRIDNGIVLSATNLHGKLVFERHSLTA
jgi:hypothetical protein